jgi:hypothetical protein
VRLEPGLPSPIRSGSRAVPSASCVLRAPSLRRAITRSRESCAAPVPTSVRYSTACPAELDTARFRKSN